MEREKFPQESQSPETPPEAKELGPEIEMELEKPDNDPLTPEDRLKHLLKGEVLDEEAKEKIEKLLEKAGAAIGAGIAVGCAFLSVSIGAEKWGKEMAEMTPYFVAGIGAVGVTGGLAGARIGKRLYEKIASYVEESWERIKARHTTETEPIQDESDSENRTEN